jgi:hypothetical protein
MDWASPRLLVKSLLILADFQGRSSAPPRRLLRSAGEPDERPPLARSGLRDARDARRIAPLSMSMRLAMGPNSF